MSTSNTEGYRYIDKVQSSESLKLSPAEMRLKICGNILGMCFVVKAARLRDNIQRSMTNQVVLNIFFEGDNRKRTLRAKWRMTVAENVFESERDLPDSGQLFCSVTVSCGSSVIPFSFTAAVFSNTLQLESGATSALDQRPLTNAYHADYETGAGSDVTLSASGRDFPAHKVLLSARSPVFRALFATGMQEQQTQRVEITNVEPDVLKEVLRYVYTNRVLNIDQLVVGLVHAAHKYGLQGLKDLCEDEICATVTKDNALDLLVLAHLAGCGLLKRITTKLVRGNFQEICNTPKWKEISKNYISLVADMFVLSASEVKEGDSEWRPVSSNNIAALEPSF